MKSCLERLKYLQVILGPMQYNKLVEVYEKLESTSKRLEKTYFISKLLKQTKTDDLGVIILLLQGRVFPKWDETKIGVASKLIIKALKLATGFNKIEEEWRKIGDLGEVAEKLVNKKKQATLFSRQLTVKKVFDNIQKLSHLEGKGSVEQKIRFIAELLTSAKPNEAKYIVRTILEDLRVGVGEGSVRDAIAWAYFPPIKGIFYYCKKCKTFQPAIKKCLECDSELDKEYDTGDFRVLRIDQIEQVDKAKLDNYDLIIAKDKEVARQAYNHLVNILQEAADKTNDFAKVAEITSTKSVKGLSDVELSAGHPIKVMLYPKAKDIEDGFERLGRPAALEFKYDGFRIQVHKKGSSIKLFTRRLDEVTNQFPEVVKYVKQHVKGREFILDSEAVGFDAKTGKYQAFQHISQRIKRKYNIKELAEKLPVELNIFDVISYNGKNMLKIDFVERRKLLKKVVESVSKKIVLAKQLVTDDVKKARKFYEKALDSGEEGIMMKKLKAPYKPGARIGYGFKVKPTMEALDLVIVGAEWGTGKRANWLSSFMLACRDENDELVEIGKVGTGFKEKKEQGVSFEELTELLKPLIVSEKGRVVKVKPKIVIEVAYEEIQKSPTYSSGYALRFPRLLRLRHMERGAEDCSTLEYIEELYYQQKK